MTLDQALAENAILKANLEALTFQLEQLKRLVFGHRRETLAITAEQGQLAFGDRAVEPIVTLPEIHVPAHTRPALKPKRQAIPDHLPREIEILDLAEDQKPCPCCGGERHVIGEAITEKLDYVPAQLKVLQTRRPKYACRSCAGEIGIAKLPPQAIEQGMAAPGLLAHVLVGKFVDHLPLNRQEAILRRDGIDLPRSTLCDWVLACGELFMPLYVRLIEVIKGHDILHGDDTTVPLQAKGGTITARAWNYLAPAANLVAYDFTESRQGQHPQSWLKGWQGYLVADAYSGYDRLFDSPTIKEVGCWAHARRKFFEVARQAKGKGLAHEAVARIGAFYHLDGQWQAADPDERRRRRQDEIGPLLDEFKAWCETHHPKLLPHSPLAKAMGYTLNQWGALTRFLEDGRLPLDNNAAERALRLIALGRKNWLFAGSVRGGKAAAVIMSLTQSAKLQGKNPFAYLKDVLTRLPSAKAKDLDALLPHLWQPA